MAKACACHGSSNTGLPSSPRGSPTVSGGADVMLRLPCSGRLKVVVPQVHVDAVARRGVWPPEFARLEAHAVHVLRIAALLGGTRIREDEHPVVGFDPTAPPPHVARQPRVAHGMDVACNDPFANHEP